MQVLFGSMSICSVGRGDDVTARTVAFQTSFNRYIRLRNQWTQKIK